jgi:hypothetical protein
VIEMTLGHDKQCTMPMFKTTNPVWQAKFHFFVSHPENETLMVEVRVWRPSTGRSYLCVQAKDDGTKRSLGKCEVSLKALLNERNLELHQHTFSLSLGTHISPLVMTVRLRVRSVCSCCVPLWVAHSGPQSGQTRT